MNEDILKIIKDTMEHKKMVLDSAYILCEYLFSVNKNELGIELIKRAVEHDNSKFTTQELQELSTIKNDFKNFKDPSMLLSDEEKEKIKQHWKNNRHHPEHFSNIENMTDVDMLEMICDWHARSKQYNTNLLDFIAIRQKNRFHFPTEMYSKIIKYAKILIKNTM